MTGFGFETFLDECDFTLGQLDGTAPFDSKVTVSYAFEDGEGHDTQYDAIGIVHEDDSLLFGFHWVEPDDDQIMEATEDRGFSKEEREALRDELISAGEVLLLRDIVPLGRVDRIRTGDELMRLLGPQDDGQEYRRGVDGRLPRFGPPDNPDE